MDKCLFKGKPINFRVFRSRGNLFNQFLFPADSGDQSGKLSARSPDGVPVRVSDFYYAFCQTIWNCYHQNDFIIAKIKD